MTNSIYLTTSQVLTLDGDLGNSTEIDLPACSYKWRQKKLWIQKISDRQKTLDLFPALKNRQWLTNCLQKSAIEAVCIDPQVGGSEIKLWADICREAKKQIYLRIPSSRLVLRNQQQLNWQIKRVFDWLIAGFLLLLLSPVMLSIALLVKLDSPGTIFFRQWRVGRRGKLFGIYKFRTMVADAEAQHDRVMENLTGLHKQIADPRVTRVGKWLCKYSLDELPQLLNVLRGEMSLVGPRPWALYDALRLGKTGAKRLNALPGITGAWQVKGRSRLSDLEAVNKCDLDYLDNWSLQGDLIILLLTIPQVIRGFGAY